MGQLLIKSNQTVQKWIGNLQNIERIKLCSGAILELYFETESENSEPQTITILQNSNSKFKLVSLFSQSQNIFFDIKIQGNNTETFLYNLFNLSEDQSVKLIQNYTTGFTNNKVTQLTKVILKDSASAKISHTIKALETTQNLEANQKIHSLLESPEVKIQMQPVLQIQSESVSCKHGATQGYLDYKVLYFLQSRGMSKQESIEALNQSFQQDILQHWQTQ
jgi:Fe-S cluster assembly protein SufD